MGAGADDGTFKKQTYLERTITHLTIQRTMFCFFLTAFSIPFWIPTTYKSYLSEIEPYSEMFTTIREVAGDAAYQTTLGNFVEI